jgi:hypothetical protein
MDNKHNAIGLVKYPKKFYLDFYQFLKRAGIDFVKVDNQGAFQDLVINGRFKLWDSYRRAVVESAEEFLMGRIVHCMSLAPHILFDPILSQNEKSIFR